MHRKIARPYGQSTSMMRLVSMLMALLVLGALYERLRDPSTWKMFADDKSASEAVPTETVAQSEPELVVPGPNDEDEAEVAAIQEFFELVTDKSILKPREMDAYWRLMDWSRTVPFDELKQRAKSDVPFTQLWEQPEKYRGKPIKLRLHVRRVLEYDAPENPSKLGKVYEAWGWTKVMTYTAFDHNRGAPLLVGRARLISTPVTAVSTRSDSTSILVFVIAGIIAAGIAIWAATRPRGKSSVTILPNTLTTLIPENEPAAANPFEQIDHVKD